MADKSRDINRREFLSKTVSGVAAAGLVGLSGNDFPAAGQEPSRNETPGELIQRTLGRTGIRLPIVNMGVMNSSDPALVKRSYEMGVRLFDTAAWYMRGRNEEMVGQAIKEMNVRDKTTIATKVFIPQAQRRMNAAEAKEVFMRIANESLARLQTDHVDILYSHNVDTLEWLNHPGVLDALQTLKEQRKARFIGFTTHTKMADLITAATASGPYEVIETAYNYAMSDDQKMIDALRGAAQKGIGLVAMKTQCSQYWYREYVPRGKLDYYQGKIMHTAVLKWALKNDYISTAIPGYTSFQQMEEDVSVARNLDYTPEEKQFLEDKNVKLSLGYCRQCESCLASCPRGADVPTLMRIHMYLTCYGNLSQARDTIDDMPESRGLKACAECETCLAACAHRIDIARRIDDLKTTYIRARA